MDVEAFYNGCCIRRAVAQVAVIVICLQRINQNVRVGLSFVAVLNGRLKSRIRIDE